MENNVNIISGNMLTLKLVCKMMHLSKITYEKSEYNDNTSCIRQLALADDVET